jgi:hypothetical protein
LRDYNFCFHKWNSVIARNRAGILTT